MRSAWRMAGRSRIALCLVALLAIVQGLQESTDEPTHWRNVVQWLDQGIDPVSTLVAVLVCAWVIGPDSRPGVERDRACSGLSYRRWMCQRLLIIAVLLLSWWVLTAVTCFVFSDLGGPLMNEPTWASALCLPVVRAWLVGLWTAGAVRRFGLRRGGVLMGILVVTTWVLPFTPDSPLATVLRVGDPVAALRAMQGSGSFPWSRAVQLASFTCITICTCLAFWAAMRQPSLEEGGAHIRRRAGAAGPRPRMRRGIGLGLALVLVGVGGLVIPRAVTTEMPIQQRPYLRVEEMVGAAPEQQAEQFILSLRTNFRQAGRFVVGGDVKAAFGDYLWAVGSLSQGTTFTLQEVHAHDYAIVVSGERQIPLCMSGADGTWKVVGVHEDGDLCG